MAIQRDTLSLAAEFAVASELCRRNIYAQLTLGLRKRTDILVETENGMLRIQVKGKQKQWWPGCKGIYGDGIVLIFVDFENKKETERPDFYILTVDDWKETIWTVLADEILSGEITIDEKNMPFWASGEGGEYKGTGIKPEMIKKYKEQWDKIRKMVGGPI